MASAAVKSKLSGILEVNKSDGEEILTVVDRPADEDFFEPYYSVLVDRGIKGTTKHKVAKSDPRLKAKRKEVEPPAPPED